MHKYSKGFRVCPPTLFQNFFFFIIKILLMFTIVIHQTLIEKILQSDKQPLKRMFNTLYVSKLSNLIATFFNKRDMGELL